MNTDRRNGDHVESNQRSTNLNHDINEYEQDLSEQQNAQDDLTITRLEEQQFHLGAEWLRRAMRFRVDPVHPPYVVEELEHRATRWRWTALITSPAGLAVMVYLTVGGVVSPFWGMVAGVLAFATATLLGEGAIAALDQDRFVATFAWWIWTPAVIFGLGALGLCAARLPGWGDFFATHQALITLSWLLVEFGLLWSAAACFVAAHYYGWSGRITSRYLAIQDQVDRLHLGIQLRKRSLEAKKKEPAKRTDTPVTLTIVLLLLTLLHGHPLRAQCLSLFDDDTQSLLPKSHIKAQEDVLQAIQAHPDTVKCISVVRFSAAPPESASTFSLQLPATDPPSAQVAAFIYVLNEIQKTRAEERKQYIQAKFAEVRQYLREALPEPPCTSGQAISDRIAAELDDGALGVLITDGVFDCASPPVAFHSFENLLVFLVPYKNDDGTTFARAFAERKKLVQRYFPGAQVYPAYILLPKLEKALTAHSGPRGPTTTKARSPGASEVADQ